MLFILKLEILLGKGGGKEKALEEPFCFCSERVTCVCRKVGDEEDEFEKREIRGEFLNSH